MAKPPSFRDALAKATPAQRMALDKLQAIIRKLAPDAVEGVNYGIAAYLIDGQSLVGLSVSETHLSFFPMTGHTVEQFREELKSFNTSKGTIRFTPEKPLPATLVRKIVKARLVELAAKPKKPAKRTSKTSQTDPAVDAYLKSLEHPAKKEIEAIRKIILGVDPAIREGIKWNSPSFRLDDWFATLNLHKGQVRLILHSGAKAKSMDMSNVADPKGLLQWLAKDRAMVTFEGEKDLKSKRTALVAVVKIWIRNR
jgi:uncharacterized protein YdhG (YjbR/CyaY superfamily)